MRKGGDPSRPCRDGDSICLWLASGNCHLADGLKGHTHRLVLATHWDDLERRTGQHETHNRCHQRTARTAIDELRRAGKTQVALVLGAHKNCANRVPEPPRQPGRSKCLPTKQPQHHKNRNQQYDQDYRSKTIGMMARPLWQKSCPT